MIDNFLDLAQLDNIPDLVLLEDGSTHRLQILKATIGESKDASSTAGQKYLMVLLKAVDEPNTRPFNHVLMLPFNGQDREEFDDRGRRLRTFFKAFDFDYTSGWNIFEETAQLVGCEAEAIVRIKEQDGFEPSNSIKKFV